MKEAEIHVESIVCIELTYRRRIKDLKLNVYIYRKYILQYICMHTINE